MCKLVGANPGWAVKANPGIHLSVADPSVKDEFEYECEC